MLKKTNIYFLFSLMIIFIGCSKDGSSVKNQFNKNNDNLYVFFMSNLRGRELDIEKIRFVLSNISEFWHLEDNNGLQIIIPGNHIEVLSEVFVINGFESVYRKENASAYKSKDKMMTAQLNFGEISEFNETTHCIMLFKNR